jgi:hypothetical protein
MNVSKFSKVRGIYGNDYDSATKEVLFSFNHIKKAFFGKTSQGDMIIDKISMFIENKEEIRFSSEMISEIFSGTSNRTYWIQNSFNELENWI